MEKEALISSLKERAGVENLSDRTFEEVADAALPLFADDSSITDDTWKPFVQMLKSASGQLRHELSVGIADYKTKAEAEQETARKKAVADAVAAALEEERKKVKPQEKPLSMDDVVAKVVESLSGENGALKSLSDKFDQFTKNLAEEKQAALESNVRDTLRRYLIDRGADEDDFALDYTLEKVVVGEKPDIAALKAEAEKSYEANYKRIHKGKNTSPWQGGAGDGEDSTKQFQSFIEREKSRLEAEKKDAEAIKAKMV